MSEWKPTDTILGTDVTIGEVEKDLREGLKTDAKFGANAKVSEVGDGNGVTSIVALVTCDWVGASEDEKLPSSVVLKIPSLAPMKRMNSSLPPALRIIDTPEGWAMASARMRAVHNLEIETYRFFEKYELTVPKLYFGHSIEPDSELKGQLCMEFVDNSTMMNLGVEHTVDQIKEVARAIGRIHGCSIAEEHHAEFTQDMFGDFIASLPDEVHSKSHRMLFNFDTSPRLQAAVEAIEAIGAEYRNCNLHATLHKQLGYKPVIVNGDLRTENVLIDKSTGHLVSLIDWQCTHYGVGVEDLLRLSLFGLPADVRRDSKDILIKEMYDAMVENLNGAEVPYTLEQLIEMYDLLFPICSMFFTHGAPSLLKGMLGIPGVGVEEKGKILGVAMEKVIGALEDAVKYHEANKKSTRNLKFELRDRPLPRPLGSKPLTPEN